MKLCRIQKIISLAVLLAVGVHAAERRDLQLPKLENYVILPCDFHSHTVFSDGEVWPSLRVREAWQDGLAALALTDHLEYLPHDKDMRLGNWERAYELALPAAEQYGLILIKGAEITRAMPPGHLNALFLNRIEPLNTKNWRDAVKAAFIQGAFIFWNHPGWTGQQPDGVARWYDEHSELLSAGMLHGIEIVNEDEYYPAVHQWCLEKNLTMLGNSDIHGTTAEQYNRPPADHRPMTWVLATERSAEAVKKALFERRTVVYWRDQLIGRADHLASIFSAAVVPETSVLELSQKDRVPFRLVNTTDLSFELTEGECSVGLTVPRSVSIPPGSTVILTIQKGQEKALPQGEELSYKVANLIV
ncbi:MAG: histidinol-phosphatase, partial [candidate division KSB1 bacterium]|nr:histidinol-phosphatase [candidate division KSB1 bacterium]